MKYLDVTGQILCLDPMHRNQTSVMLRFHPVTGRWELISPNRQKESRPQQQVRDTDDELEIMAMARKGHSGDLTKVSDFDPDYDNPMLASDSVSDRGSSASSSEDGGVGSQVDGQVTEMAAHLPRKTCFYSFSANCKDCEKDGMFELSHEEKQHCLFSMLESKKGPTYFEDLYPKKCRGPVFKSEEIKFDPEFYEHPDKYEDDAVSEPDEVPVWVNEIYFVGKEIQVQLVCTGHSAGGQSPRTVTVFPYSAHDTIQEMEKKYFDGEPEPTAFPRGRLPFRGIPGARVGTPFGVVKRSALSQVMYASDDENPTRPMGSRSFKNSSLPRD